MFTTFIFGLFLGGVLGYYLRGSGAPPPLPERTRGGGGRRRVAPRERAGPAPPAPARAPARPAPLAGPEATLARLLALRTAGADVAGEYQAATELGDVDMMLEETLMLLLHGSGGVPARERVGAAVELAEDLVRSARPRRRWALWPEECRLIYGAEQEPAPSKFGRR